MIVHRTGFIVAVMLGLGLARSGPALAQLGQPGQPTATPPAGLTDPGLGGAMQPGTSTGTSSGVATPSGNGSNEAEGVGPMPTPRAGGPPCAPPGSAAAFAGTSQPGLCPASPAGGGGSPGAGFSGGAAGSSADALVDPINQR